MRENSNRKANAKSNNGAGQFAQAKKRLASQGQTEAPILHKLANKAGSPEVLEREAAKSVSQRADELLLQERFSEAEQLYERLSHGLEELLGPQHMEVSNALHKLAASLGGQNKTDEAAEVEARASSIKDLHQPAK